MLIGLVEVGQMVNLLHQTLCIEIAVLREAHDKLLSLGSGCDAIDQVVPLGQGG